VWINRTSGQWEDVYGNIRISPSNVSITMPGIPESDFDRFYHLRSLRVTFFVSVEAGFEVKYPGEEIYVTVGGASVSQLAEYERTITVARPADPISVSLPGGLTQLITDDFRQVANQKISDIEITVYEPHKLNYGSEIWIHVSGDAANRSLGLNINANQVANVDNDSLQLGAGRWLGQQAGAFGFGAIAFPITRVPSQHEATGPITIRIKDVRVTGNVIPGINYYVIVSGSAFAENDQIVFQNRLDIDPVGVFTSLPYSVLTHSGGVPGFDTPPEDDMPEQPGPAISISQFDRIEGVAGQPILFREVAGTNVGFVSARAFAALIGSSPDEILPNTPAPGTHTIIGRHTNGNQVSVAMQSGSATTVVYVNGEQHPANDIAAWAGSLSGVAHGQLLSINVEGNLFLPFRAAANMFGYDVEMINDFTVLFAENTAAS